MMNIARPLRHVLPVKLASRYAGYLLTAFVTAMAIVALTQFDLSSTFLRKDAATRLRLGLTRPDSAHIELAAKPGVSEPLRTEAVAAQRLKPEKAPSEKKLTPVAAAVAHPADAAAARPADAAPALPSNAAIATAAATNAKSVQASTAVVTTAAEVKLTAAAEDTTGYRSRFIPPPGGCKEKKQMIILHWDPHWEWHRHPNGLKEFLNCEESSSHRCLAWFSTSDRSFASKADIIVAHDWSGYPAMPERAFPNQLFMYMTMESPYSGYSAQHLQHMFNLAYKYHLSSHVRAAYIPIGTKSFTEIHGAPHFTFKEKIDSAVSSLVSNCGGFVPRLDFMRDLHPHVPVHSFGRCFHNHELTSYHDISLLEKYKVAMVFENSLCQDYVTEKWWRALTQGTIPLVTSNNRIPDYRKYSPTLHSYVDYGQFKNMDALVVELKKIMTDEDVFNKYMEYRFLPEDKFNPLFRDQFSSSSCDDFCKLGLKMNDPDEMAKLVKGRNSKDESCRPHGILK